MDYLNTILTVRMRNTHRSKPFRISRGDYIWAKRNIEEKMDMFVLPYFYFPRLTNLCGPTNYGITYPRKYQYSSKMVKRRHRIIYTKNKEEILAQGFVNEPVPVILPKNNPKAKLITRDEFEDILVNTTIRACIHNYLVRTLFAKPEYFVRIFMEVNNKLIPTSVERITEACVIYFKDVLRNKTPHVSFELTVSDGINIDALNAIRYRQGTLYNILTGNIFLHMTNTLNVPLSSMTLTISYSTENQ